MGFISRKKLMVAAGVTGVVVGGTAAFAYCTTTSSGSGSGTVGSDTAMPLHQDTITYSNAATDHALLPGTSADVTFTVDNDSSGHQLLNTISLSSVTSNKAGCDSTTHPTWFTMPNLVVNHDYAPGDGQAVSGTATITFNDVNAPQDDCKGAALTFHYSAN